MPTHTLHLEHLALRGGESVERSFDLEIGPVRLGGLDYNVVMRGEAVVVTVERISGGYLVTVAVQAAVYGPCYRCLREVTVDVDAEQQEFVPTHPEEWDPADLSPFIEDFVVDVAGLAREALILALPEKILDREDCPGLCAACGRPLEDGTCSCGETEPDPRWDKLRQLGAGSEEEDS